MKVFVGGSRSLTTLGAGMRTILRKIVTSRDMVLVGDRRGTDRMVQRYLAAVEYTNVVVCTSRQTPRNNEGGWSVRSFWSEVSASNGKLAGNWFEAVEAIVLEADRGLVAWDGRSEGTFLSILMLAALGKTVHVVWRGGISDVERVEDVLGILPRRNATYRSNMDGLSHGDQERIISAFVPSGEMAGYLFRQHLSKRDLIEIILESPLSLQDKYDACKCYAEFDDAPREAVDNVCKALGSMSEVEHRERLRVVRSCCDRAFESSFSTHLDRIGKALQELCVKGDELFYRKSLWDEQPELYEWHEHGVAPFVSFEMALKDLRCEIAEEEWDADTPCWTVLEKWRSSDTHRMWCKTYTYYLIRDEVVFFEKNYWDDGEREWRPLWHLDPKLRSYAGMGHPSLPTPFDAGDIVALDCRPFAPLAHGLVLLPYNCTDRYKPYLLVRNHGERSSAGKDPWRSLSLENGAGLHVSMPGYSPLYRVKKCSDVLPRGEGVLRDVQCWIAGDRLKAKMLDEALMEADDGMSDSDLRTFIEKQGY